MPSDTLQFMPQVLQQMNSLIKLHTPDKFLEDSSFGSNFRDPKAAVSWKLGHSSTCTSLKIWIITHEH